MRFRLLHAALITAVGAAVLAVPTAATAATTLVLAADTPVASGNRDDQGDVEWTELLSTTITAGPGQPASLLARFRVERPADSTGVDVKHMAEGRVQCFDGYGNNAGYVTVTQNIWAEGDSFEMIARMLIVPTSDGAYTCRARARVEKCASGEDGVCPNRFLVFKAGPGNTELTYASPTWAQSWGTGNDAKHPGYVHPDPAVGIAYPAATHIHAGITDEPVIGDEEYVAKNGVTIPAGPKSFNVISNIHMTTCFRGDITCFEGARLLSESTDASETSSVVTLWIEALQLAPDGQVCATTTSTPTTRTILGDSHHQTVNLVHNNVQVSTDAACQGSRRFAVKTYVERVSGNPIRIERGDITNGKYTGFTHSGVYYAESNMNA